MRKYLAIAAAALMGGALATGAASAQEEEWPTSSTRINLVVPFGTGGSTDRLARQIAQHLGDHLNGAAVSVVNRPGASGAVGSAWFLQQPADGTNFLVTHAVPYLANNVLTTDAPMEWEDFDPINVQWPQSSMIFAHEGAGYETLPDLIEDIRNNPGEVSASILHGSGAHLQLLIMLDRLGIPRDNVRWVTYQGGGPQRQAVAGGNVTFTQTSAEGSLGIRDMITPLAIHAEGGHPQWEGVPYINDVLEEEYGVTVPGVGNTYATLLADASFQEEYPERYQAFVEGYREMVQSEEYRAAAEEAALGATWMGPEQSEEVLDEGFETMSEYADTFTQ